jgi:hypothetical protein
MEPQTASSCLHVLIEIARGVSHRTTIQKTLSEICTRIESCFSPRHLAVLLVEPETGDLTFSHVLGDKAELLAGKKLRNGKGIAGWVAHGGEPLLVEDTARDPRFQSLFLTAKTKGSKSFMAVPLKSGDSVLGVIELVLQLVAATLKEEVRRGDVPCRIKSDTFAVIMPNTAKPSAADVANRLNSKISQQSAARQTPFFSKSIEVLTADQQNVTPLLGISESSRNEPEGFRKFRDVASNLFLMFSEERQTMERRQYYRKDVQLAGRFENPDTGETGDYLIENVSLNGLGFTTLLNHCLVKNALIKVIFRLDDSRRTEITRMVRVRYINERYVGCQFSDQKSYDSDLGFYLMR